MRTNKRDSITDAQHAYSMIDTFYRKSSRSIIPLTVQEILDEEIAKKLV